MREYTKKPENQSRTLDSNPRASRQAPISEILQAYKNGTLGKQPVQRESIEDEDMLQTNRSRQSSASVILQRYKESIQRNALEEEEEVLQGRFDTVQHETIDEDKLLQGKFDSTSNTEQEPIQREEKPNNTGLPDNLKIGIENLSGYSMDDVKVHYNSDKPAQLQALAYTQGMDIHVAPGQEKHLPHEAWHVVQQKQGRVQPTMQLLEVNVNADEGLEKEADAMGRKVMQNKIIPQIVKTKYKKNIKNSIINSQGISRITQQNKLMPVQRIIALAPTAVNHAGILASGGVPMDMGVTQPVANEVVPTYNININYNERNQNYEAAVVINQQAFEGNSNAVYRQREIFPTGLMLVNGGLGGFAAGGANRQVYADLSAANSNSSRLAEQEHLDDLRRAFQITLGIAEWAYTQAAGLNPYIGITNLQARTAAEQSINNFINARAISLGTAPFNITTNLAFLYQQKQNMTQNRDNLGWHTFDIDRVNQSQSLLARSMSLWSLLPGVEKKDFRQVVPGLHFQVPGPTSNLVVF